MEAQVATLSLRPTKMNLAEAQISGYSSRIIGLEAVAKSYKTHVHRLPSGFGSRKEGGIYVVTATPPSIFSGPTSGPYDH